MQLELTRPELWPRRHEHRHPISNASTNASKSVKSVKPSLLKSAGHVLGTRSVNAAASEITVMQPVATQS